MSAAIFFCSSGDNERAKASLSCSILASSAQPNQPPFLPLPPMETLAMGFAASALVKLVKNIFQPPSFGGFWLARRETTVCQSVACRSTLKPAWRSNDRLRLQRHHIAGRQDHDGCAVIAGFGEQLLRLRHAVALHERRRAGIG